MITGAFRLIRGGGQVGLSLLLPCAGDEIQLRALFITLSIGSGVQVVLGLEQQEAVQHVVNARGVE
jgi:hypothetical protein